MVKSKFDNTLENDEKDKEEIEKIVKAEKPKKVIKKKYIPRSYPIKWYQAKSSASTKTATISYSNDSDLSQTKKSKNCIKLYSRVF